MNRKIYYPIALLLIIIGVVIIAQRRISSQSSSQTEYNTIEGFAQGGTYRFVYKIPQNFSYSLPDSLARYFHQINKSLSGYDSTSVVSRINKGENPRLDPLFVECFTISKEIWQATNGKFDISAAPLFDLWGFGFKNKEKITQEKIDSLREFIGMDKISIVYDTISKAHFLKKDDPRIKVNFNAIAQGYTCDYIGKKIEAMGITDYLLEVGGEILCKGQNSKGKNWKVGIDKPLDGNFTPGESLAAIIELTDQGLVTSGNYRKFYIEDGIKRSHTIDPATGYPVKHNLLSATVIAANSTIADAYATYLMVIGFDEAKNFLEKNTHFDAILVYGDQDKMKVYSTKGVKLAE